MIAGVNANWREKKSLKDYLLLLSPDMPENEATFAITAGGVADAKE